MYYVIRYSGSFGFIKPWTAVRDSKTFSQQFLTPSIIEGIRQKLEVTSITRHKLKYSSINTQLERTQTSGWEKKTKSKEMVRGLSILERGVMIEPQLYLAFEHLKDAEKAGKQHICLCRNEDVLLPDAEVLQMEESEFNNLPGFELHFEENENSFLVGFNRFDAAKPMYGWLEITGKPVLGL
ncbi:MAG: hypothetical protein LKI39_09065 [Bacteroides sp.]|jgi:hypothetical protein|nr:hypothetical protein [Bacteroides sp.]MCI1682691.1 hypothetical protein [Bacteroides sp.]